MLELHEHHFIGKDAPWAYRTCVTLPHLCSVHHPTSQQADHGYINVSMGAVETENPDLFPIDMADCQALVPCQGKCFCGRTPPFLPQVSQEELQYSENEMKVL